MYKFKYTTQDIKAAKKRLEEQMQMQQFSRAYETVEMPTTKGNPVMLNFSGLAWAKTRALVAAYNVEIAWHGVTSVSADRSTFDVHDILVYPQKISAARVEIDDVAYEKWHQALDNDMYNMLKLQGHSHVNFSPNMSSIDEETYADRVQYLREDSYCIFYIQNKKDEYWCSIIDSAKNTVYERDDIIVTVDNVDIKNWVNQNKNKCKLKEHEKWTSLNNLNT